MIKSIITLFFFALIVIDTYSQTTLKTLKEIEEYAIKNSLNYQSTLIDLSESFKNIESIVKVDSTKLSVGSSLNNIGELDYFTYIEVPIIEKLKISGELDSNLNGSISLIANPFAYSGIPEKTNLQYEGFYLSAIEAKKNIVLTSIENTLLWLVSSDNLKLQQKRVNLNFNIYNDGKKRFKLGTITLDQLQEYLIEYSKARKELLIMEESYKERESDLYKSFGSTSEEVSIHKINLDAIVQELDKLKQNTDIDSYNYHEEYSYKLSLLNQKIKKSELDSTWIYEPDISILGNIPYTEGVIEDEKISASINFSFTLDDINQKQRDIAQQRYNLTVKESALKLKEAELEYKKSLDNISKTRINREISTLESEQAAILLSEAELLYSSGDYSKLEVENARIFFEQSQNNLYEAYSQEYISWLKISY